MGLEGIGRIDQPEASRTTVYIPAKVAADSQFPFERGEKVNVRIDPDGKRLIVEKVPLDPNTGR